MFRFAYVAAAIATSTPTRPWTWARARHAATTRTWLSAKWRLSAIGRQRTVNADYVKELADGGFNRISFGMQSAVPHVLATLDRTHTPENVAAGIAAANAAGMRSSVDLIYGAPGESLDDWRTSVRTAIDLGVNHISAYALTIAPNTKMGRQIAAGTLSRPDDDDEANKYEIADTMFTEAGLEWYEISNWARPGYESQHNLGYWRNVDWAGLGPGAHSHYGDCEDGKDCAPGISRIRDCGAPPSMRAMCHGPAVNASLPPRTSKRPSCWACAFVKDSTPDNSAT